VDTTCHAAPQVVRRIAETTDLFLCDIKHMNGKRHKQYTGVDNARILENIALLTQAHKEVFIRVPIIPGFNDDRANIVETARFVQGLKAIRRIDILPYNRGGLEKAGRLTGEVNLVQAQTPSDDTMNEIAEVLRGHGFEVKIGG
jgi:pyruvate formate lyase activating enzyme